MNRIISFAGRIKSGKSELARVCESLGYKRLYFAMPLKKLCSGLLGMTMEELDTAKRNGDKIRKPITYQMCETISDETGIPIDIVAEKCNGKTMETVRDMFQFIGTDLIREFNEDWHVNRIRDMIDGHGRYVIDDVRFKNEKRMIEELGGHCWFVTRPSIEWVSNHESETSIKWHDCWNRVIINNSSLSYLLFKWETFMNDYDNSCELREKEFNRILEEGWEDNTENMSALDMLMLSKDLFTYSPIEFNSENIKSISATPSNGLCVTYKDDTYEFVYNTLNIEDMKLLITQ